MKPRRTLVGDTGGGPAPPPPPAPAVPVRVVIVTLDSHLASVTERAQHLLRRELPGLALSLHAASEWGDDPQALERCHADIAQGDIIVTTMMFMEEHIQAVLPALTARRDHCDAMVVCMSAGEVTRLTRIGRFDMSQPASGPMALLKRLRGSRTQGESAAASRGERQMRMLRRLPKILRFVPGTAQDVRAYFLTLQYWLAGSDENVVNMVRFLVERYASGPREVLRSKVSPQPPCEFPDTGLYHPRMRQRIADELSALPRGGGQAGTVGLLIMRSYAIAGNAGHYDGVIAALEARGLRVIPAFASGLDARPAVERFFMQDGRPTIDALVSLTGFSLVGGPAYNDARAAEDMLAALDVPYIAAHPVEFQTLEQWASSERGLMPVENTMMVAIPELDGSTGPMVFGGRSSATGRACEGCDRRCVFPTAEQARDMQVCSERAERLAARVSRLVDLRRTPRAERRVGVVLFNYPPNAANCGTAAFLAVFESLYNTLRGLSDAGYAVDVPDSVEALRERLIAGNAARHGADANVYRRIGADEHVRREPWLAEIERQWGPAPGRLLSDGASLFVLGERFGNVFVGIQPGMGHEGDPMRLLFERGSAPTHAFSAFYRFLREDFGAHALLHFGTHGALEFMPGKHSGLSAACWPDRLLGDTPDFYLYAANNPSEGTLAKRRAAATLLSYMTPPIANAGLYRGLVELKASIERWRVLPPESAQARAELAGLIQAQAAAVDLASVEPAWVGTAEPEVDRLRHDLAVFEQTWIPHGLHVVGKAPGPEARVDVLAAIAESAHGVTLPRPVLESMVLAADTPVRGRDDTPEARLARAVAAALAATPGADLARRPAACGRPRDPGAGARARWRLREAGTRRGPRTQPRHHAHRPQPARLRSVPAA